MSSLIFLSMDRTTLIHRLDSILRVVTILAVSIIPLAIWHALFDYVALAKALTLSIAAILIFLLFFIRTILSGKLILYRTPLEIPLFAVVIALAISTITSNSPVSDLFGEYGRYQTLPAFLSIIVLYWLTALFFKDKEWSDRLLWSISLSLGIISLLGVMQFFGSPMIEGPLSEKQIRIGSTLGNPVFLADFIAITLPLTINLMLDLKQNDMLKKSILIGITTFSVLCLILSQSRGGFIAAIAGIGLLFALRKESRKKMLVSMLIPIAATNIFIFVSSAIYHPQNTKITAAIKERIFSATDTESGTLASRLELWRMSEKAIIKDPFSGSGISQSIYVLPQVATLRHIRLAGVIEIPDQAHNEFLQMMLVSGLPGILAVSFLVLSIIKLALKTTSNKSLYLYGCLASLAAYFIKAMSSIGVISTLIIPAAVLGLMAAPMIDRTKGLKADLQFSKPLKTISISLALLLVVISFYPLYLISAADLRFMKGYYALKIDGCSELMFIEQANEAIKLNPYQPFYRYLTCTAYQTFARDNQDVSYLGAACDIASAGLKINPSDSFFNLIIGQSQAMASKATHDYQQIPTAIEHLKKRTAAFPWHPDAHRELMRLYVLSGDVKQSKAEAAILLKLHPDDKEALGIAEQ